MKLTVVCVSTHSEGYFEAFLQSCKNKNINLKVLGWKQKWKGFAWKFKLLFNFLKSMNPKDIILYSDAHDVILLENEEEIISKYKSFAKPIVFGIENPMNYKLMTALRHTICNKCNGEHIINTGLYMGTAAKLLEMFEELFSYNDYNHENDDQALLNKFCSQSDFIKNNVELDTKGVLFFNASCSNIFAYCKEKCETGLKMINGKIINSLTDKQPSLIHGPFQLNMNPYASYLGLPTSTNIRNRVLWAFKSYKKYIIKYSLIILVIIIFLFVILPYLIKKLRYN